MTEVCQKQHKQLWEYQKIIKKLEAQLGGQSSKLPNNLNWWNFCSTIYQLDYLSLSTYKFQSAELKFG